MKKISNIWQFLFLSIVLLGGLTSCGDDEPKGESIDYYMEEEEQFLVNGATNKTDRYKEHNPKTMMMEAIRNVYPKPDNVGNDAAVIQACDEVYTRFYEMYAGNGDHLTCIYHLIKAHKVGNIVRGSEELKSYEFDVNPIEPTGD